MVWVFIDDNDDEFKIYQKKFRELEIDITQNNLDKELVFNLYTIVKLKKNSNLILQSISKNLIDKIHKKKTKNKFKRAYLVERRCLSSDVAHSKHLAILKILKLN